MSDQSNRGRKTVSRHPKSCMCVVCNPAFCAVCLIQTSHLWEGMCVHRRACEARQMLNDGASIEAAAAYAQRIADV